ncbi:hypothetical protein BaRGS_00019868, partial [Batillaria attramentaria]
LTSNNFHGLPRIQEIRCSGGPLTSDVDVFMMTLFTVHKDKVVASANLRQKKCITRGSYSSCEIDDVNSRNSRLKTLVFDLAAEETKEFGCNLTGSRSDGRAYFVSWTSTVKLP